MDIAFRIKCNRIAKGLTQEQLAKDSKLSKNAIWNYENGKRIPKLDVLEKIAKALKIPVYRLVFSDASPAKIIIDRLNTIGLTLNQVSEFAEIPMDQLEVLYQNSPLYTSAAISHLVKYIKEHDISFLDDLVKDVILQSNVSDIYYEKKMELIKKIHIEPISYSEIQECTEEKNRRFFSSLWELGYFEVKSENIIFENKLKSFENFLKLENYPVENLSNETIEFLYNKTKELLEFELYKLEKNS